MSLFQFYINYRFLREIWNGKRVSEIEIFYLDLEKKSSIFFDYVLEIKGESTKKV